MFKVKNIILSLALLGCSGLAQAQQVEQRIDSLQILIGQQTVLHLKASVKQGDKVELPSFKPQQQITPGVEVVEQSKGDTSHIGDDRMVVSRDYTLTSFDEKVYVIPALNVKVNGKNCHGNQLALKVLTVPVDTVHPNQFYPPKDVQDNPFSWSEWSALFWLSLLLYNQNFERLRLPATGYEPRTFEIRTKMGEGATFKQAGTRYNLARNFYNGKPVIGSKYYHYLTVDEGISQYFVELNGKLMDDVKLGTTVYPNSFRGIEPVYDLVVTTYRNYQEKELVINLEKAGQLKQTLAKENPDYLVYRNIKVNGEIDKRDFDELASHYFKSIDLSGAKVVAYEDSKADMVPKYAFEGNATLESFKMPAGVKELGSNAFMYTKLKEIDLPETIEEFGRNTFNACFELKNVYMRHKEAPYWINWCVFAAKGDITRTLHLYPGSKAKYEAHQYTQNWIVYFDNVVEDLEPTGIHSVTLDKKPGNAAIYDLNGRRITEAMKKGVYIKNGKKISAK